MSVFGQNFKIQFLPYDPNFGQRPVCSPRRSIFYFSFRVMAVFVKKKTRLTPQKVFPLPTAGWINVQHIQGNAKYAMIVYTLRC